MASASSSYIDTLPNARIRDAVDTDQAAFSEKFKIDEAPMEARREAPRQPQIEKLKEIRTQSFVPAANPTRHVGRNDPGPCGSGNKYRKCCLAA